MFVMLYDMHESLLESISGVFGKPARFKDLEPTALLEVLLYDPVSLTLSVTAPLLTH